MTTEEAASILVRWQDRILHNAAMRVENQFINAPVEDFTEEEKGFDRGLRAAVTEICKAMEDPSYFGRTKETKTAGK
jgi:hypothetical protein